MVICHGTRCGRSAAINAAAGFASGDLLLTVEPTRCSSPPRWRGSPTRSRTRASPARAATSRSTTRASRYGPGLQSVEYLMSISAGRSILEIVGAIACLSGACSMYRRDTSCGRAASTLARARTWSTAAAAPPRASHPVRAGSVGGNRRADERHRPPCAARALGPRCAAHPLHDVRRVRLVPPAGAPARHAATAGLHLFDLVPTLSLPFYLVYVCSCSAPIPACSGRDLCHAAVDLDLQHGAGVRHVQSNDRAVGLESWLIFPFYQGVFSKLARFFSYSSEIIFASSRHDDFVPPRVRRASSETK